MKILLLLPFFLLGCSKPKVSPEVKGEEKKINIGSGFAAERLKIHVVILDGNEYYATMTHNGHYTLCPKLPPKKAAETP